VDTVNSLLYDLAGPSGDWDDYLASIHYVDNLICQLWQKMQTDDYYKDAIHSMVNRKMHLVK
jgi:hypothetical protein